MIILEDVLEKRIDVRVPCALPVQVALPTQQTPVVGQLVDVSSGGLCMRLNRVLRPGQEYPVYIAPGAGWDGMFVNARPVWIKATADGYGFDIGCRFTDGGKLPPYATRPLNGLAGTEVQKRRMLRLVGTFDTQLRGKKKLSVHAVTKDVSFSGAGLVSPVGLPLGTQLTASFNFIPHGVLRAPVEVVYCAELPGSMAGYKLGLSFLPMEPRQAKRLATVLRLLKRTTR